MKEIELEEQCHKSSFARLTFRKPFNDIKIKVTDENVITSVTIEMLSKQELFELRNHIDKLLLGI